MVLSTTMNDESTAEDERMAKKIAWKSSLNVIPLAPNNITATYPIPEDLKMALELNKGDPRLSEAAKEYSKIIGCLKKFREIKPNHYWFLMKLLIYLEHYQAMVDTMQYSLYNQRINLSKYNKSNLVIHVPGLAEERPSVRSRDLVIINQVNGDNHAVSVVSFVGEKYISTKVEPRFLNKFKNDQKYNIHFMVPDYCLSCMHYAVDRAEKFDLLPILFPTGRPSDKIQQQQNLQWIDQNIRGNPEQQQAVVHILTRSAFPAPYILFGPPGTGKTSTLVEAIGQILKKNPANRILVCTPSNAAADEIAVRLLRKAVDGHDMHRMYSISRDCKDISETLKPSSNFAEDKAIYISYDILITKKVVIVTLITCHRLIAYKLRENHFSYVFIDEAGQATEPETLIPLTLMSSSQASHKGRLHGQLVIAGDPKQLGPSVQSRIAEPLLGRSMLERLMEWDIYRKKANNKFNPSYVTKLIRNYRCHPTILEVPNKLFYEGELKACGGAHTERATNYRRLPKPNFPVVFHAVEGKEERSPQSPSVFNSEEVSVVMSYVRDLLHSTLGGRDVRQDEIGIVTPYRLQRQKIHEELTRNQWFDVSVGTVETFQGQERDVIILSTVRSVLYHHNGRYHIGFLSNPKRFNVALTRAKALLIVVGNPVVLQVDLYWRAFIHYCHTHGSCCGSEFPIGQLLKRNKMRELMGRKHVPVASWDPNVPFEIVEEEPTAEKELRLPEKSATRRRRLPRSQQGSVASGSDYLYDEDSSLDEDESIEDGSNPWIQSIEMRKDPADLPLDPFTLFNKNVGSNSEYLHYDVDGEDEYEMNGLFSDGSEHSSGSASGSNEKPKDSDNWWDATSSTTTTDKSDKSPDCDKDNANDIIVSPLNGSMRNLKINNENAGY